MLSLSPAKLLVVLIVALIVLGPEKLPGVARQIGAAWGDLRRLRGRLESEVRGVFPDMPPAHEVARAVRSPLSFLDRLADEHERSSAADGSNGAGAADGSSAAAESNGWAVGVPAPPPLLPQPPAPPPPGRLGEGLLVPDDPSMN